MPSERVKRRIEVLLDDADVALAERDWRGAAEICRAVLALDADNEDEKWYLTAAEEALGDAHPGVFSGASAQAADGAEPSSTDIPSSFANGRYKVTGFLGEGGKKKVYLAHDTTLDRDVAFALIKVEGLDDTSRQRITREAQAMARLGDNPNIMPIFDLGEENGHPYMVGPLLGGGDVETLIENAGDGRLSLGDALRIAREVCSGGGFRVDLAWSLSEYAGVLLERDAPGDRERATEHQDEAIAIAQELGMRPLLERLLAQREMLEA